jgi:hypothetical protein
VNWEDLHTDFIQAMVQSMYHYEASQVGSHHLLTNTEMGQFYLSYCYL